MTVKVILFALARDLVGKGEAEIELSSPATVGQLRQTLKQEYPPLANILDRCMIAVNEDYARDEDPIPAGATIACIPPVSGGSSL